MKTARKEKPLWDFYYDKQLETLLQEYEFDFARVAETFNLITESELYTKENCEDRYTEIYKERKRGEYSRLEEEMEAIAEGKLRKKTLYEALQDSTVEQIPKNYLKVAP
jgi:hypothetical protein